MPFDPDIINQMLPVDKYVGGPEHACMHLLYARFITKALRDMGYLKFGEPFTSLTHQGIILGPDGNRMSKSRGNVVSPDTYIDEFGSDVFRTYLMFGFSYIEGGPFSDDGIKSIARFLDRIERLVIKASEMKSNKNATMNAAEKELDYVKNNAIKCIVRDVEMFSFNTSIARLMEYVNALQKYVGTVFGELTPLLLKSLKSAHFIGRKELTEHREIELMFPLQLNDLFKNLLMELGEEILCGERSLFVDYRIPVFLIEEHKSDYRLFRRAGLYVFDAICVDPVANAHSTKPCLLRDLGVKLADLLLSYRLDVVFYDLKRQRQS
jgi:hypothetical protein